MHKTLKTLNSKKYDGVMFFSIRWKKINTYQT